MARTRVDGKNPIVTGAVARSGVWPRTVLVLYPTIDIPSLPTQVLRKESSWPWIMITIIFIYVC